MRRALALVFALGGLGCSGDEVEVAVDVVTDFVPGIEITLVRAELFAGATAPPPTSARRVRGEDQTLRRGEELIGGQRIAEWSAVARGTYVLRVQLLDATERVVAERVVRVPATSDRIVRVVITRDCGGVRCPRASDSERAVSCCGGTCSVAESSPTGDACPSPECRIADDCGVGSECATPMCLAGVCLFDSDPSRCAAGQYCAGELGCRNEGPIAFDAGVGDAGRVDAGARDAGGDAGPPECDAPGACDDGDPCTTDVCDGGRCVRTPVGACCTLDAQCDDGDRCTADGCAPDTNTCRHAPITDCCVNDADCADASSCTIDTCDRLMNVCTHRPVVGCCSGAADCDDGNVCTMDSCESGTCRSTALSGCCVTVGDCPPASTCRAVECTGNRCTTSVVAGCCTTRLDCEDTDGCTTDTCNLATMRCAYATMPCSDGNPCTTDSCVAGACMFASLDGATCDDGNRCTSPDRCSGAMCTGVASIACSDALACTSDTCDPATGDCRSTVMPGYCLIAGVCRNEGATNPANSCQVCDPFNDPGSWTNVPEMTPCGAGRICCDIGGCRVGTACP